MKYSKLTTIGELQENSCDKFYKLKHSCDGCPFLMDVIVKGISTTATTDFNGKETQKTCGLLIVYNMLDRLNHEKTI